MIQHIVLLHFDSVLSLLVDLLFSILPFELKLRINSYENHVNWIIKDTKVTHHKTRTLIFHLKSWRIGHSFALVDAVTRD